MTRIEFYHVIIGAIGLCIWLFGQKFGLPVDAISFAQTATVGVVGHAIGLNATPKVLPDVPAQPVTEVSK